MEITIGNRFSIKKQIGSGSFGEIFQGIDLQTNQNIAIKLEKVHSSSDKNSHQHSRQLLKDEAEIYKILDGMVGVPRPIAYGAQSHYNILVIDLLDKSLEDLLKKCKGRFSLKTVLMLADQMLLCIEGMHRNYLVHRDLKPENFMMGFGPCFNHKQVHETENTINDENLHLASNSSVHFEFFHKSSNQENFQNLHFLFSQAHSTKQNLSLCKSNSVHIIDFGLSKYYYDVKQGSHIPLVEHPNMTGTARYASVSALHGMEQSRRDDLESLGYILIYFLKGKLPWQGLPGKNRKEKINNILSVKAGISVEDLCDEVPYEFADYLSRVKKLHFTEEPNYSQYREMFRELFIREGYVYDYKYDWLDESPIDEEKRFRFSLSNNNRYNTPNIYNYSNQNSYNNDHDIFGSHVSQGRNSVLNYAGNGIFRNHNFYSNEVLKKIPKNRSQMDIQNLNLFSSNETTHHQSIQHHIQNDHEQQENQQQQHNHPHQSLQELIYIPQSQQHVKQNIIVPQNRKKDQQHRYSDMINKVVNSSSSSILFPTYTEQSFEAIKNNGISTNHSQILHPPTIRNASPTPIDRYIPYNNNAHPMKIQAPSQALRKPSMTVQLQSAKPIGSPSKSQIPKPINMNRFILDNQK